MLSKGALTTSTRMPMTFPSAAARSADIPVTVFPSGAMNSFGGYVASAATFRVPWARIASGMSPATKALLAAGAATF